MWYKLDELEEKYGLSKLSVYKLITQEPELRQYFKSLEGVLQINDQGIGVLLKHTSKEAEDSSPATYADNNTIVMKKEENIRENIKNEEKEDDIDLFADAFNTKGSFFDDVDDKEELAALEPEENFFSSIDRDYKEDIEEKYAEVVEDNKEVIEPKPELEENMEIEPETDFADGLIFQDEVTSEIALDEPDEVNASIYDDTASDDFFKDEPIDHSKFLNSEVSEITEITAASADDYSMEGYIKALKEKLIIQNEQVRAISNYLDISKKLLIQDEKIVNIIEGMGKSK